MSQPVDSIPTTATTVTGVTVDLNLTGPNGGAHVGGVVTLTRRVEGLNEHAAAAVLVAHAADGHEARARLARYVMSGIVDAAIDAVRGE